MSSALLITGGTGTLGRLVVRRLRTAGVPTRVLSRGSHRPADGGDYVKGDLATGEGVDRAVEGIRTVVHLAGSAKGDEAKARTLLRAAARAGATHVVYISVVGADRIPVVSRLDRAMFGYFAAKHAAERLFAESGLPWTTLRATQFHDLALMTIEQLARLPVTPYMSGFRFQPIDADEVAARLVELALGRPSGLVPEIGGPRVYGMDELVRSYLHAAGRRRLLLPMRIPGCAAEAFRDGANLTEQGVGQRTWEDFLAERLRTRRTDPATPA